MASNNYLMCMGPRETGKTTYLFRELLTLLEQGIGVIVLDSATDHPDKSLIMKVEKNFASAVVLKTEDEKDVVVGDMSLFSFIKSYREYFPYKEILQNRGKLVCFDLAFFLERAHDIFDETGDEQKYRECRAVYNNLAVQIVLTLLLMKKNGELSEEFVIMDEIEFPSVDYSFSTLQEDDELGNVLKFIAAIHPENILPKSFYDDFKEIKNRLLLRVFSE